MASIQGIYIALFGRPADPVGLAYFNGVTGNGADLTAIGDLASTAEYQDRFAGKSNVEIITDIYQALFGRAPEQTGLDFFTDALTSGRQTINTIAINILDGASGDDLISVEHKVEGAALFTSMLDQASEIEAYRGNDAADIGRQFIAAVTATDEATPGEAEAAIDQLSATGDTTAPTVAIAVEDQSLEVGESTGVTFTFSEAVKDFTISDLASQGGTLFGLTQSKDDPNVYTAIFTAGAIGQARVDITGPYTDLAGNAGGGAADAPLIVIEPGTGAPGGLDVRSRTTAITVDASLFTGLDAFLIRDEGGAGPTTLDKLTSDQINNISVQHGITGSNAALSNVIIANLATQTDKDTATFLWADQLDNEDRLINSDPRFNQTFVAAKVESITLVDQDTESNSILLPGATTPSPYDLSNTLSIQGGTAGTFLNLDAVMGLGNLYGKDMSGGDLDVKVLTDIGTTDAVRFSAATIDASTYLGDVIVRVDTLRDSAGVALPGGGQSISMGVGGDTVIFDALNDTTAGLTIGDTVKGGEGLDTLAIDGDGVRINISASEWTNVSGFESIRLVGNDVADDNGNTVPGNNDAYGRNAYNLTLTNELIAGNGSDFSGGRSIGIVNDNDPTNEATGVANVATNTGITIDARGLNAKSSFNYDGEEGVNRTADRFIMADANVRSAALIDGGFNSADTGLANQDVLEIRNAATILIGDLAALKNIGTIEFSNDRAANEVAVLRLDATTVEALVDSTHTAIAGETETLTVNAFDNPFIANAFTILSLDASQVTNAFLQLMIQSGGGNDIIKAGAGDDVISAGLGTDTLTGGGGGDDFLLSAVKAPGMVETDLVTDFSVAQNDQLGFSVADLGLYGDNIAARNLVTVGNADADVAAASAAALVKISAATDLGTVSGNILLLDGNFANAAAVEAAIVSGGSRQLTLNGQFDKGESFLVVYDDGTSSHVALVTAIADTANDAKITDVSKIDTFDLVTLTGIADATTLSNAHFLNFLA